MLVLKDGWTFGLPLRARAYPDASDFLATYGALGASYLIARIATKTLRSTVRILGWVEVVGFGLLAGFELLLVVRRIWLES